MIQARNQIVGMVGAGPMIVNDWAISVEKIEGGQRLVARRGTEEQFIEVMDGSSSGGTYEEIAFENLLSREKVSYEGAVGGTAQAQEDGSVLFASSDTWHRYDKRFDVAQSMAEKLLLMVRFEAMEDSVYPFSVNASCNCMGTDYASVGTSTESEWMSVERAGAYLYSGVMTVESGVAAQTAYCNAGLMLRTAGAKVRLRDYVLIDVTGLEDEEIAAYDFPQYLDEGGYFESVTVAGSDGKAKAVGAWSGREIVFIGDSLTSALRYQDAVKEILGAKIRSHCAGGATLQEMVDGGNGLDGVYSAETDAQGILRPLSAQDVAGADLVVLYGGYNNRWAMAGVPGDCFAPDGTGQSTYAGCVQYAVNRIYEALEAAGNPGCRLLLVTPDCVGAYASIAQTGYDEYPEGSGQTLEDLVEAEMAVAQANGLPCLDLFHTSGINRRTWAAFSASAEDQVHKNSAGYARIGEKIAGAIIREFGN